MLGCRHGSDPAWLWRRPGAVVPIRPLAWEPPYAAGAALKSKKKKRNKENDRCKMFHIFPDTQEVHNKEDWVLLLICKYLIS